MGVACSRGNYTTFDEEKKPITKEIVTANGVNDNTVPTQKQNGNSNTKSTDQKSDCGSNLSAEVKEETVKVRGQTPEPVIKDVCSQNVYKGIEHTESETAISDERGNDTLKAGDEISAEHGNTEEDRGTEHSQVSDSKPEESEQTENANVKTGQVESKESNDVTVTDQTDCGSQQLEIISATVEKKLETEPRGEENEPQECDQGEATAAVVNDQNSSDNTVHTESNAVNDTNTEEQTTTEEETAAPTVTKVDEEQLVEEQKSTEEEKPDEGTH